MPPAHGVLAATGGYQSFHLSHGFGIGPLQAIALVGIILAPLLVLCLRLRKRGANTDNDL